MIDTLRANFEHAKRMGLTSPRFSIEETGAIFAEIDRLRAALAAEPAATAPAGTVAWHIRIRGCDGSADWCDLGAERPDDVPPEADALPLVYAQTVPDAVPVLRGAAMGDALRWAIKACGAVQRDDGVWFGDSAAAKLARVLSEGAAPAAQQAEPQIPPGWKSSYAIGDLLLAVTNWKATTPRNARPAFDALVKACAALVAAAHPQQPAEPLTVGEAFDLWDAAQGEIGSSIVNFARAVERRCGITATQAPTTDKGQ